MVVVKKISIGYTLCVRIGTSKRVITLAFHISRVHTILKIDFKLFIILILVAHEQSMKYLKIFKALMLQKIRFGRWEYISDVIQLFLCDLPIQNY